MARRLPLLALSLATLAVAALPPRAAAVETAPPAPVDVGQPPQDQVAPPAGPAGPLGEEVAGLIKQLGADDFKARDAASKRLREIGPDALGPLTEARKHTDPEVASRADGIIRQITRRPSLFGRPGRPQDGQALGQRMRVSVVNGSVQTEVFEGDQQIRISETPGEISVSVSGFDEGQPVSEKATAATPEELRAKHPEAYALYQRWGANRGGGMVRLGNAANGGIIIRGGGQLQINVGGNAGIIGGVAVAGPGQAGGDDLARLRRDALRKMLIDGVPADRRTQVLRTLDELAEIQNAPVPADPAERAARMKAYNDKCDEVRKQFAELKLPDPGNALPPPAQARLGITVGGEGPDGLTVGATLPDSRAAKIGLQAMDVIRKVNDKPVTSTADLRRLVTEHEKLSLLITRDGKELKLDEKP